MNLFVPCCRIDSCGVCQTVRRYIDLKLDYTLTRVADGSMHVGMRALNVSGEVWLFHTQDE